MKLALLLLVPFVVYQASVQAQQCSTSKVNLMVILENSNEIKSLKEFRNAKCHVKQLLKKVVPFVQTGKLKVGIKTYGSDVYKNEGFDLTSSKNEDQLLQAVDQLPFHGDQTPNLDNTVSYTKTMLDGLFGAQDTKNIFVYVSTGKHSGSGAQRHRLNRAVTRANLRKDALVMVIALSEDGHDEYFNFAELNGRGNIGSGPMAIRKSKASHDMTFERIEEQIVKSCGECYSPMLDVVFLVDLTVSRQAAVQELKDFMSEFVKRFTIGDSPEGVLVGVCAYSRDVHVNGACFKPGSYTNSKDLLIAIANLNLQTQSNSQKNTGKAVKHALDNWLLQNARPLAKQEIIILTDRQTPHDKNVLDTMKTKAAEAGVKIYTGEFATVGNARPYTQMCVPEVYRGRQFPRDSVIKLSQSVCFDSMPNRV